MLVIIDMQPEFPAARKVVSQCIHEVRRAKKNREHIILVEYARCGWTYKHLTKAIGKYPKLICVQKSQNDGSAAIQRALRRNLQRSRFKLMKVCGVNISYCVRDTVEGLSSLFPEKTIRVLRHACACGSTNVKFSYRQMARLSNVALA